MVFLSFKEIFDILVITIAIGFIFKDFIPRRKTTQDPLDLYKPRKKGLKIDNHMLYASLIVAPTIILHEFGHKFVAMAFGAVATFNAAYTFLGLGVILKLMNFGFIFFVPAYVAWSGAVTNLQAAGIAFAGPAVNGILWLISFTLIKLNKLPKYRTELIIFARINAFLAIFNMIPIPPFDGSHVVSNLIKVFV